MNINWDDPTAKISQHFTVKEALWLPSWNRMANASDGLNDEIKNNLVVLFNKLDSVREYFNKPMIAHCAYRPPAYNSLVGGAAKSSHMLGRAFDFHVQDLDCDIARSKIMSDHKLEIWNLRMEMNPGGNWLHLDNSWAGGIRYFKP